MRKLVFCVVALIFSLVLKAQDDQGAPYEMKTLFGNGISHGFYGGLTVGYGTMDKRDAILIGAKGAWIINHRLGLGIAGNGMMSEFKFDAALNADANFTGGYGGFLIEPIFFPESPVHFTVPVIVGAGGVAYGRKLDEGYYQDDNHHNNYFVEESEPFFFVKPGIEMELNLIKFMRLSVGAYYMQTSKINMTNASSGMLNGFSGMMTLKFGRF